MQASKLTQHQLSVVQTAENQPKHVEFDKVHFWNQSSDERRLHQINRQIKALAAGVILSLELLLLSTYLTGYLTAALLGIPQLGFQLSDQSLLPMSVISYVVNLTIGEWLARRHKNQFIVRICLGIAICAMILTGLLTGQQAPFDKLLYFVVGISVLIQNIIIILTIGAGNGINILSKTRKTGLRLNALVADGLEEIVTTFKQKPETWCEDSSKDLFVLRIDEFARIVQQELVIFNQRDPIRKRDYHKRTKLLSDRIRNLNWLLFENEEGSYDKFLDEAETIANAIRHNTWGSLIKMSAGGESTKPSRIGVFAVTGLAIGLIIMALVSPVARDVLGVFLAVVVFSLLAIRLMNENDLGRYWITLRNFAGVFSMMRGIAPQGNSKRDNTNET